MVARHSSFSSSSSSSFSTTAHRCDLRCWRGERRFPACKKRPVFLFFFKRRAPASAGALLLLLLSSLFRRRGSRNSPFAGAVHAATKKRLRNTKAKEEMAKRPLLLPFMSGVLKMHKNVHTKTSLEARRCLDFFREKNRKIHCCTTMLLVSSSCKKPRRRQTDGGRADLSSHPLPVLEFPSSSHALTFTKPPPPFLPRNP